MSWFDWLITIIPLCFVMGLGLYTRKFMLAYQTSSLEDVSAAAT